MKLIFENNEEMFKVVKGIEQYHLYKLETTSQVKAFLKNKIEVCFKHPVEIELSEEIMQIITKPNEEFVECPHCNCTYSNVSAGDYFECGGCESYLYVEVDEKGELYI